MKDINLMFHSEQQFIIDGDRDAALPLIFKLAYQLCGGRLPKYYRVENDTMIFRAWVMERDIQKWKEIPDIVTDDDKVLDLCTMLTTEWLKTPDVQKVYPMIDHYEGDGTSKRGWTVFVETKSMDNIGEIFRVKPSWTYYAK